MILHWRSTSSHLLLIAGLSSVVVFINASGSERSLRLLDRDLYTVLRGDHPDLLRNLDLSWAQLTPIYNLSAMNLAGEDLRGLRMHGNRLNNLDLSGSHLEQAEFKCVSMKEVVLSGANLKEARFDYSDCPNKTLRIDLNGADLSSAMLIGGTPTPGRDSEPACNKKLTIEGNLNGARFNNATLQCIVLINRPKPTAGNGDATPDAAHSRPEYSGINFVNSNVNALTFKEGDFRFSDFYRAKLKLLAFDPKKTLLAFSTLANLQCTDDSQFCRLMQIDSAGERPQPVSDQMPRLSLNLRGSSILSNLPLPVAGQWPAYLCDKRTRWQAVAADTSLLPSKTITSGGMGTSAASPAAWQSQSASDQKDRNAWFFLIRGPATNSSTCSLPP